jgi:NADPH:quinone reductase-like Zn-dependent oxidoreductase
MVRAIDLHRIKPVIDSEFPLENAQGAFEFLKAARHFGKIIVKV